MDMTPTGGSSKRKHEKEKLLVEERSPENALSKDVIHEIIGEPIDRDSEKARGAYARATQANMKINYKTPAGDPKIHSSPADSQGVHCPHNDTLVISITLANYIIGCIFVDSSSSANVLFYKVYQQMELGDVPLELMETSLYGFLGEVVDLLGQILLPFFLGAEPTKKTKVVYFLWWTCLWPTTLSLLDLA
ncbi:UNVERIFIED_CONTAM: hypothetical protein Sindi_1995500 [Sesamum indicum]